MTQLTIHHVAHTFGNSSFNPSKPEVLLFVVFGEISLASLQQRRNSSATHACTWWGQWAAKSAAAEVSFLFSANGNKLRARNGRCVEQKAGLSPAPMETGNAGAY
jgi:hypothetical protein